MSFVAPLGALILTHRPRPPSQYQTVIHSLHRRPIIHLFQRKNEHGSDESESNDLRRDDGNPYQDPQYPEVRDSYVSEKYVSLFIIFRVTINNF